MVIETQYVEQKIPLVPRPEPIKLNNISWNVVTEDNFEEFLANYKRSNGDPWVFFTISPRSYETMALNLAEMKRYLLDSIAIIEYYENSLTKERVEEADKKQ